MTDAADAWTGRFPLPAPIWWLERCRVAWHGRRDARHVPSARPEGTPRYVAGLCAAAERGHRAVGDRLHREVAPVDQAIAHAVVRLRQFRREPTVVPAAPKPPAPPDDPPKPVAAVPLWVVDARQVARAQRELDERKRDRNRAEQDLARLLVRRFHTLESARHVAGQHTSRYEVLLSIYRSAWDRAGRRGPLRGNRPAPQRPASWIAPRVTPQAWLEGDLPIPAPEIDVELLETYRWALRDFDLRLLDTPVRDAPVSPTPAAPVTAAPTTAAPTTVSEEQA